MATYLVIVERIVETSWKMEVEADDSGEAEVIVRTKIGAVGGRPEDLAELQLMDGWAQRNRVRVGSGVRS